MEVEHKKIWIKGLLIDCTFGEALRKCPARRLRKLPVEARMAIVDSMLEAELDALIEVHKSCVAKRAGRKADFYG